jgi:hypothetical protein
VLHDARPWDLVSAILLHIPVDWELSGNRIRGLFWEVFRQYGIAELEADELKKEHQSKQLYKAFRTLEVTYPFLVHFWTLVRISCDDGEQQPIFRLVNFAQKAIRKTEHSIWSMAGVQGITPASIAMVHFVELFDNK